MFRTTLMTSIATLAIVAATPAFAGPGGGHAGGGAGASAGPMGGMQGNGGINAGGNINAGAGGLTSPGATIRDDARINSQGSINANSRAIDRANANSAIQQSSEPITGTRIPNTINTRGNSNANIRSSTDTTMHSNDGLSARTALSGVATGMTVVDASGATVGTVTSVRTVGNGMVKSVQLTLTDGRIVVADSRSLSLSGGVLTTKSLATSANGRVNSQGAAHANINGLTHASPRSALSTAGITTLTGLTTGLTVNNSAGTSIGTVSNVIMNRAGAVVGVQVSLTGGGTVTLPATTLSMDGTTVVTTSTAGG